MEPGNRLTGALGVQPGEGLLVSLLFALSLCITGPFVLAFTAGNALVLGVYGAEGLPYVYLAVAVLLGVAGLGFARAERHVPLGRLLAVPWAAMAGLGGLVYLGLAGGGPDWLTIALLIWAYVISVFGELAFWALAGRLLNLAQGKRLFGLIGSGALAARLVLYTGSALLVAAIGTLNLTLVALGGMVLALALLLAILRRFPPAPPQRPVGAPVGRAAPRSSSRRRYILLILGLVLVGELGYTILEYFFFERLAATFPDPDRLAQFFGVFAGVLFLCATLVSATLTGPFLRRFGVRLGLASEPLLVGLGMALALGAALVAPPGAALFAILLATKFADDVADSSVNKPATQLLFQPLPAAERVPAQALATSVVKPVAVGLTGVLLLALQAVGVTGGAPLAALILALTIGWLALALLTYRAYVAALGRALARRLVGSATVSLDRAGLGVVERALASPRSVEVLSALDLLASERPALYAARLPALLRHPEPGVRREVAARVGALGLAAAMPELRALAIADADPSVRAAAVAALGRLGEPAAAALDDPSPAVRVAALVGQLRHGERAGALRALAALAAGADPTERAVAARVAGAAADGLALAPLLADPSAEVRRAALRAVTPELPAELWPAVVAALDDHACRGAALAGLEAGGHAPLPPVPAPLDIQSPPRPTPGQLARACGREDDLYAINYLT
ncbi:MAG TPA: HEAT repeat domain-containing protein, partial [Chloroflexaceae bacterium]|nr:HEAT repeat domain-containing protein [Chloroflexaceae bacterium]